MANVRTRGACARGVSEENAEPALKKQRRGPIAIAAAAAGEQTVEVATALLSAAMEYDEDMEAVTHSVMRKVGSPLSRAQYGMPWVDNYCDHDKQESTPVALLFTTGVRCRRLKDGWETRETREVAFAGSVLEPVFKKALRAPPTEQPCRLAIRSRTEATQLSGTTSGSGRKRKWSPAS